MARDPASPLAPLRHPDFRLLWTATLVANLGTLIQGVGAAWAMAEMTPSAEMVALVQASATLPIMLLAMIAGAVADNLDRRRVMLIAQGFMAVVSAALALIAAFGLLDPMGLLFCTFLLGMGAAMHLPAWQASTRDLVPLEDLAAAVTLNSMGFNLMRSIGPAMGGIIVALAGASAAFAFNSLSYLAVIYALWRWQAPHEERLLPAERLGNAVWAGIRYISMSPNLVRVMVRTLVFALAASPVLALLPVIVRDRLDGGASAFGLMLGVFGLGAIGGALSAARARAHFRVETIIAVSFLAFALGCANLAVAHSLLAATPGLLLAGVAWVLAFAHFNVSTQLGAPRWVVGRALAVYQTTVFGGQAIGAWLWGSVAELSSLPMAFFGAAALLLVGAVLGLFAPIPELSDANLDPANRFNAPALRLDLKPRSGPIVISVDWIIPPARTNAFLSLMAERRRILRRDGAGQWILTRNLENPDLWVETYRVATWTDYLRHNQRRTHADLHTHDRLLALHRGPNPPRVHRQIERPVQPRRRAEPIITPTTGPH